MENNNVLKRYFLVRFNRRTGKIDTSMNAWGNALLRLWALQNTTAKSKDTIVFDEDGWIHTYYEGTGDFPKVTEYYKLGFIHISTFCVGLLEACLEGWDETRKEEE